MPVDGPECSERGSAKGLMEERVWAPWMDEDVSCFETVLYGEKGEQDFELGDGKDECEGWDEEQWDPGPSL